MKRLARLLMVAFALLAYANTTLAQVTTGTITGFVKDDKGEAVQGAYVKATHVPSGTAYYSTTQANGRYIVSNLRIGRDYEVEVSFLGHQTQKYTGITVALGTASVVDVVLPEESIVLSETVVVGQKRTAATEKTGAVTSVNRENIATLPSITRSLNDFTRLTPQANGNSFAGRDARYNFITIDGSAFNNSFGLSGATRNLPGGDAQPISLDAIEEISVSIAPYDIRQSNFTGASINAVTKSGTNSFRGTAYTYQRPESFVGMNVAGTELSIDKRSAQIWGASLGGPILRDKLFFFVNGEIENTKYPSTPWRASTDGVANPTEYISRTKIDDLKTIKSYLQDTYGYDPGDWNFGKFSSDNYKILARLDWNISRAHKLSVRYNQVISSNDVLPNATSAPIALSGGAGRISDRGFAFTNAGYYFENSVYSITAELNSVFQSKYSNKFLVTYTNIRDTRGSNSDLFPFVDIMKDGAIYNSFGYELYTYNNDVKNKDLNIINNFTAYLGEHTITGGAAFEYLYFGNAYMRFGTSYYRYNSMDDFLQNARPSVFAVSYGFDKGKEPYSELAFGLGAVYLQDEWQINRTVKLTGGVRLEMPFYLNSLESNTAISNTTFVNGKQVDVGSWPDTQVLFSPRLGFNWDVFGDRSLQARGGTGIFTGRLPFVWFTNQPTNAGVLQNTVTLSNAQVPADMTFNPNWQQQIDKYPALFSYQRGNTVPSDIAVVDKKFKMPQVWRTNLALDYTLPWLMTFTLEGIFSKDINGVAQVNINEPEPNSVFTGSDNRPRWTTNRQIPSVSSAMLLTNTQKGYQYSITALLTKAFSDGLSGSIAYTFSEAKDLTSNPGDQAASAWRSNVAVGSLNNPGLSYSNFSVPHRVVGSLSYSFGYLNSSARTTLSVFYVGSAQGRLSYMYSNDMNGDGQSSDLMYIPKDANDIIFVNKGVGMSPQEQSDAFFKFLEQDPYLSKNRGKYADRYGAVMPWRNQFDLKFIQEFAMDNKAGTKLQFSLDILNIGNLINNEWGIRKRQITGSYDNVPLLRYEGVDATGRPTFSLDGVTKAIDYHTETYKDVLDFPSTWSMQFGIRLIF